MTKGKIVLFNTDGEDTELEQSVFRDAGNEHYELIKINSDIDDFFAAAKDADAVVAIYLDLNPENLARLENVKIVALPTIGYDNVDLVAATASQVYVTNCPDYCVEEVANCTVMLVLAARGRLRSLDKATREGRDVLPNGKFSEGVIHRLSTQVHGVVSFGNIGRKVAQMMQGLGVAEVVAFDPFASAAAFDQAGVKRMASLDELLQHADIVSLHTPLTPETRHMIGERELKLMKNHACLVNAGRGGLIDEAAAAQALSNGDIGSLATDVLEDEVGFRSPLLSIDSVFATPHTAFYSEQAVQECRIKPLTQIISVLERGERPEYMVNKPWN